MLMSLGKPLIDALQRMNYGGAILDAFGNALQRNSEAVRVLRVVCGIPQEHELPLTEAQDSIKSLLRSCGARFVMEQETWAVVSQNNRRQLVVHAVQIGAGGEGSPDTVLKILIDLHHMPPPNPLTLMNIFGLSVAEANLAIHIARREALADIAARGASRWRQSVLSFPRFLLRLTPTAKLNW